MLLSRTHGNSGPPFHSRITIHQDSKKYCLSYLLLVSILGVSWGFLTWFAAVSEKHSLFPLMGEGKDTPGIDLTLMVLLNLLSDFSSVLKESEVKVRGDSCSTGSAVF